MTLLNERVRIVDNECVGPNLYLMTIESPGIAASIEPGQFVHMRVPGMEGHILRRPFSVYARDAHADTLDVLYQAVGFGTAHLASLSPDAVSAGDPAELIGPVGHAWCPPDSTTRALIVGGGVGAAPVFMLSEQLVSRGVRVDVVLGAQTKAALVCADRYTDLLCSAAGQAAGCETEPRIATDDGSCGRAGFCTSLVEEALEQADLSDNPYDYVACCGPEPLMKIVAGQAALAGVHCEVSLEKRMACGVGACLSCVVETVDGKKRSCVDGPIFDARKVVW